MGIETSHIEPWKYYVYGLLCQDEGGPLYVKFGRTTDPERRMVQLKQGVPLPARWFLYVRVAGHLTQGNLERGLHKRFKSRRIRGEWFKFDATSEVDKEDFRRGCRIEYAIATTLELRWKRIHVPSFEKKVDERRRKFIFSKSPSQLKRLKGNKSNQRELEKYRDI